MEDAIFWIAAVITPIVFGVGASVFVVYLSHRRKELLLKNAHTERMTALEKGLPVPDMPASLLEDIDAPNAAQSMRNGLALTLIGIVLYFGIRQFIDKNMALFGLIPTAIGVANLVYAAMIRRRAPAPPSAT
jgi:hypothetical protein